MRITRTAAVVAATALIALTAACGGASGPEGTTEAAFQAILDDDVDAFCELVTFDGTKPTEDDVKDCADTMDGTMNDQDKEELEQQLKDGAEKVEEDDDTATVTYEGEGNAIPLVKIDGDWYIDLELDLS